MKRIYAIISMLPQFHISEKNFMTGVGKINVVV